MITANSDTIRVCELVDELCARNAPAEIHYETPHDRCATARVRMLCVRDDVILTDQPRNPDRSAELAGGKSVTVHVRYGDRRCAFVSRVIKPATLVRVNGRQRVLGLALAMPLKIESRQRRRDYRVSVAGHAITCRLSHEDSRHPMACSRDAAAVDALLANLATRGIAIAVDGPRGSEFAAGNRLFCQFDLPDDNNPVVIYGEIRHVQATRGGQGRLLGVMSLNLPEWTHNRYEWRINRFIIAEQRRQLRRRR